MDNCAKALEKQSQRDPNSKVLKIRNAMTKQGIKAGFAKLKNMFTHDNEYEAVPEENLHISAFAGDYKTLKQFVQCLSIAYDMVKNQHN